MNVTLALLLAVPLFNCGGPSTTFEEMLDSTSLVVIARVDSIWYPIGEENGPYTHVMAELLGVYTKDTTLVPSSNFIHIVYGGGRLTQDKWVHIMPSVSFANGEIFLAPLESHPQFKDEDVYKVVWRRWKYIIANDSVWIPSEGRRPLGEILEALTLGFNKVER